jgi:hypothetical protein
MRLRCPASLSADYPVAWNKLVNKSLCQRREARGDGLHLQRIS